MKNSSSALRNLVGVLITEPLRPSIDWIGLSNLPAPLTKIPSAFLNDNFVYLITSSRYIVRPDNVENASSPCCFNFAYWDAFSKPTNLIRLPTNASKGLKKVLIKLEDILIMCVFGLLKSAFIHTSLATFHVLFFVAKAITLAVALASSALAICLIKSFKSPSNVRQELTMFLRLPSVLVLKLSNDCLTLPTCLKPLPKPASTLAVFNQPPSASPIANFKSAKVEPLTPASISLAILGITLTTVWCIISCATIKASVSSRLSANLPKSS